VHGSADLADRLDDLAHRADEIERVLVVFDELDRDLDSAASKLRYLGDVSQFYEHLQRRRKTVYNPAETIDMEYGWERSKPDNPALSSMQVRWLYDAVESPDEELLVLALCGGVCVATRLRRCTSPSLHSRAMTHTSISRSARTDLARSHCSMVVRR